MKLTFLGTGTSTGVPQLQCKCDACTSTDPHDRRRRCSAMVETGGRRLLIDCGPDFYEQMLLAGAPDLDAALLTHSHYDHVGGIDDLRPYCGPEGHFPLYCKADVARDLRERVPYCFAEHLYPGVPTFAIHEVTDGLTFDVAGVGVTALPVMHWHLPILGFRIGNLAYITDCKTMPDSTIEMIRGIDTLVINALRFDEHPSHMNLSQALDVISMIKPRRAWLTHISHQLGREAAVYDLLPDNVRVAFDGLVVDIPDNPTPAGDC